MHVFIGHFVVDGLDVHGKGVFNRLIDKVKITELILFTANLANSTDLAQWHRQSRGGLSWSACSSAFLNTGWLSDPFPAINTGFAAGDHDSNYVKRQWSSS